MTVNRRNGVWVVGGDKARVPLVFPVSSMTWYGSREEELLVWARIGTRSHVYDPTYALQKAFNELDFFNLIFYF